MNINYKNTIFYYYEILKKKNGQKRSESKKVEYWSVLKHIIYKGRRGDVDV